MRECSSFNTLPTPDFSPFEEGWLSSDTRESLAEDLASDRLDELLELSCEAIWLLCRLPSCVRIPKLGGVRSAEDCICASERDEPSVEDCELCLRTTTGRLLLPEAINTDFFLVDGTASFLSAFESCSTEDASSIATHFLELRPSSSSDSCGDTKRAVGFGPDVDAFRAFLVDSEPFRIEGGGTVCFGVVPGLLLSA